MHDGYEVDLAVLNAGRGSLIKLIDNMDLQSGERRGQAPIFGHAGLAVTAEFCDRRQDGVDALLDDVRTIAHVTSGTPSSCASRPSGLVFTAFVRRDNYVRHTTRAGVDRRPGSPRSQETAAAVGHVARHVTPS